ncbi:MAG TPA: ATP-binding cassette domain-containing protein [Rhizomicrobium sp.]|jgi:osmoprotectant transport system ATP-binding protein|nr:ATP-binding cassette domain-containing protein [Rhizomicrobium sp.]
MTTAPPAILIDQVTKLHAGGVAAVADVSFAVAPGEFFVLIGESGCGKTTTLHLINRLSEPSEGRVLVDGADIAGGDAVALRRSIGFVFQEVGLFPHLTVEENVAITPRLLGWSDADIASRVEELLALVRLDPQVYRRRFPRELSGGQRQRVGVARALAARPRIMLMDEPFAALDPVTREELAEDYREIHDRLGLTTVLVTHDMTEAFLLADRVAVMRAGRIVQIGTPHELLATPADDFIRELIETPRRRARKLAEAMRA